MNRLNSLEQLGTQALLSGLQMATDRTLTILNEARAQLGMPAFYLSTDSDNQAAAVELPHIQLGGPKRERPRGSSDNTHSEGRLSGFAVLAARRALLKQAGMPKVHGSPSLADEKEARRILGIDAPVWQTARDQRKNGVRRPVVKERWNLVKAAGMKISGSPSAADAEQAKAILARRSVTIEEPKLLSAAMTEALRPLPPSRRKPMSQENKDNLRNATAYRWKVFKEAGLNLKSGSKMPSGDDVKKAEKILAARKYRKDRTTKS